MLIRVEAVETVLNFI
jgi:hypothetical protein